MLFLLVLFFCFCGGTRRGNATAQLRWSEANSLPTLFWCDVFDVESDGREVDIGAEIARDSRIAASHSEAWADLEGEFTRADGVAQRAQRDVTANGHIV